MQIFLPKSVQVRWTHQLSSQSWQFSYALAPDLDRLIPPGCLRFFLPAPPRPGLCHSAFSILILVGRLRSILNSSVESDRIEVWDNWDRFICDKLRPCHSRPVCNVTVTCQSVPYPRNNTRHCDVNCSTHLPSSDLTNLLFWVWSIADHKHWGGCRISGRWIGSWCHIRFCDCWFRVCCKFDCWFDWLPIDFEFVAKRRDRAVWQQTQN